MGRRTYRRITATLGVQYDTRPEQIEAFCEGIREILRRQPYTRKDYYHVYLNGFSDSSLDIMLYCFVECPDWSVELREKHRLFVDIIRLAETLGVSFAFPTRTLHLFQEEHAPDAAAADLSPPDRAGQRLAAKIAGPLLSPEQRPGGVEFRGPTPVEEENGWNGLLSKEPESGA
jgi:MscS family membrane protein